MWSNRRKSEQLSWTIPYVFSPSMLVIVGLYACMKPHSDLNFCPQGAYGKWNPRINVLACVKHIRLKIDIDWQQSDLLLHCEAVGCSSTRLINSFHSWMCAPIDSSLCRLTPSLKKKLLCGYSLKNACPIQWAFITNQLLLSGTRYLKLKWQTNVLIVLGIL